ncbi:hypothetical protein D3C79_578050 [compost metagenome]
MRGIGGQVCTWLINSEFRIGAERDQRSLADTNLARRYVIHAFADVQQHLNPLIACAGEIAARLDQVGWVGALMAGDLPHRVAEFDLVALGAGLGQRVTLLRAGA